MIFRQFYLESLGHASYMIGSEATGDALVFDARRDVDCYFEYARSQDLRLRFALDSHAHNDYLSGLTELVVRSKPEVLGSAYADLAYRHRRILDGETLEVGNLRIEVIHTPGHTPEHLSLVVYDEGDAEPALLLSGGALLVGDVARPDLLGGADERRRAADAACRTLQEKILPLPDHVLVYPTHVAGSLCGANIGSRLVTTIGYERRTNDLLKRAESESDFAHSCISMEGLPAVPPYWRRMRRANVAGVPPVGITSEPAPLSPAEVAERAETGAIVLDVRTPEAFAGAHVPGALNVGLGPSFPTWAGTVVAPDADIVLVVDAAEDVADIGIDLQRIGYPPPTGWLAGGMRAWQTEARPVGRMPVVDAADLKRALDVGEVRVLDVRQPQEWRAGHIPDALWVTGAEAPERIDEVPEGPLAVVCGSGYRASVVASLLRRHGHDDVSNVLGGMQAWTAAGYATVA